MKKRVVGLICLISLFLLSSVLAISVEDEIQKITHYAEEYETGNINYIQLLLYSSAVKQNLNKIIGTSRREGGAILKQEELKRVLGEPDEETNWIWVEEEESEKRLDRYVPVWRKIIFDGNKLQMRLNAWPNLKRGRGDSVLYDLHFETLFKKPKGQLDIKKKAEKIKGLAEIFNSNPTPENGLMLAKESVHAERIFEEHYRQSSEQCEDLMKEIFGSENQRRVEKMLVQEINFYQGENFDVIVRLEMCEECEWHWMNVDFWFEGRGGFHIPEEELMSIDLEKFRQMSVEEIKQSITRSLGELKQALENKDFNKVLLLKNKFQMYNRVWNEKANDVWKEIEKVVESERKILEQRENTEKDWINFEKNKRKLVREKADSNYKERKQFYMDLFFDYNKKEFMFTQNSFEKRLIEEFKEFGEEICDNRKDDNDDGAVDCRDSQCAGKICGSEKVNVVRDNKTVEVVKDLYCIGEVCQLKEDIIKEKWTVCGDHVCEGNETVESCAEDCMLCPKYPPIECMGKVIFKGKDKNGCLLEPICIEEKEFCETDDDCVQPLCGVAKCVKGDWKEYSKKRKVKKIVEEEVVEEVAEEENAEEGEEEETEVIEEDEEEVKEEEVAEEENAEEGEEEETEETEEEIIEDEVPESEEAPITGGAIFRFFGTLINKITGFVVNEKEFEKELPEGLGRCRIIELEQCREEECTPGDERIKTCESGDEIVADKCIDGLWRKTGVTCGGPVTKEVCCKQQPIAETGGVTTYKFVKRESCQEPLCKKSIICEIVDDSYCKEKPKEKICCEIKAVVPEPIPRYEWKLETECPLSELLVGATHRKVADEYCEEEVPPECPQVPVSMLCSDEETLCPMKEDKNGCTVWDCDSCEIISQKPIVGDECTVREDCGGENDVCSNGKCVIIPMKKVEEIVEEEEVREVEEKEIEDEQEGEFEDVIDEDGEESGDDAGESRKENFEEVAEEEPEPEEEPELESESEEAPITGDVITGFQIKDSVVVESDSEAEVVEEKIINDEAEGKDVINEEAEENFVEDDKEFVKEKFPGGLTEDEIERKERKKRPDEFDKYREDDREERDDNRRERGRDDREEQEGERRKSECEDRCKRECYDKLIQPCVDFCIHNSGCFEKEGACDEELKTCKESCGAKGNEEECIEKCFGFCKKGEDPGKYLNDIKREELFKQEKGVFQMGGSCRTTQGKTEASIWFDGWGEPFEQIQPLKQKYYSGGETDWWKKELENLKKQRKEFEKGFNEEFVAWFFEKYLANSAEDWENHVSGIFDLYWNNVDISRQIAEKMSWLDVGELSDYNLINVKYETEYGSLEFWEEVKTIKLNEIGKKVQIISPYMKIWIFPPKEFIKYEMQKAMEGHKFPMGPEEDMEEMGITEEDREMMRQDKGLMDEIREISGKYDGNLDAVIQFKDYEADEVVFNVYAQVNEKNIISIEPMLPEEVPAEDARIEIDFEKIYDLIYTEQEMMGAQLESPPWDKKSRTGIIKGVTNKVKIYLKRIGVMKSMKFYPAESKGDMKFLAEFFFDSMGGPGESDEFIDGEGEENMKEAPWRD